MRFADVDTDGATVDSESDDRILFHVIETRNANGDLPIDEAWTILADRYPDEPRLRILAWFHDLQANGVDTLRDPTAIVRALKHLAENVGPSPEMASLVVMAGAEITDRELMAPLEKLAGALPEERIARRTLRKLGSTVLDEAEEKTQDNKPFGIVKKEEKIPVATGPLRPYSPQTAFDVGDRVAHSKFGEGIVLSKAEGKIEVHFSDVRRRLISA